tara:strand:- start:5336 stop:5647 length:312 start_codon:yes stop_codon:yes gene_type:complete
MNEENKIELFSIVSKAVVEQGLESVARKIQACNMGNLDGSLVTNENLHLFRQFRNGVSNNAYALVYDAINWATKYLYLPKEQERELSVKRTEMYMSEEYSHCK